jgi:hypothetical protein
MSDSNRHDDVYGYSAGSSLIPTAIPIFTDLEWPQRKPRWSARLAKLIAYSVCLVAFGAAGIAHLAQPSTLVKAERLSQPSLAVAVHIATPSAAPMAALAPVEPVVVLDTDTIVGWPPVVVLDTDTIVGWPSLQLGRPVAPEYPEHPFSRSP